MVEEKKICIPRIGVFWPVVSQLPTYEGDYPVYDPRSRSREPTIIFNSEEQALVSLWLYGFSYRQLLILFPKYKLEQRMQGVIHPPTITQCEDFRQKLVKNPPRQLVDVEWIDLVKAIGAPSGKVSALEYRKYMEWVHDGGMAPWLKNNSERTREQLLRLKNTKIFNLKKLVFELKEIKNLLEEMENEA